MWKTSLSIFVLTHFLLFLVGRIPHKENVKHFLPSGHQNKQYISRAGGIVIGIVGSILGLYFIPLLYSGISGFTIGIMDDLMKKRKGLSNTIRLFVWSIIGANIGLSKYITCGSLVKIPLLGSYDFGIFYMPFIIFFVVSVINGVNMTDGLDGLVTLPLILNFIFIAIIAHISSNINIFYYSIGITCTLLAFLRFNLHPARLFMGDSGAIFLGTVLAHCYVILSVEFFMPIVGFVFFINVLCSSIQIFSLRILKKRIFKMAPLHHHFELSGYKETTIVFGFWFVAICTLVVGFIVYKI